MGALRVTADGLLAVASQLELHAQALSAHAVGGGPAPPPARPPPTSSPIFTRELMPHPPHMPNASGR
ncbi:hypothetical protein [Mycolicibacterium sp. CBMA 234]|uniref:hypothetical protein n=1 Tax=Mycolicibacterium sp. CBMA 234 TaxID=1918495 RepID=UPI0012DD7779|nr:hypothetical protein [Mycolicibacterium sp. CBMA 234]